MENTDNKEFIKNYQDLMNKEDINEFWRGVELILKDYDVWDTIINIKKKGGRKSFKNIFGSFVEVDDDFCITNREAEDMRRLGKDVIKSLEDGQLTNMVVILTTMVIRHVNDLLGIKTKELDDAYKQIMQKISDDMLVPFTVLCAFAFGRIYRKLNGLNAAEQNKFFPIFLGLWLDMQELMHIEEILNTHNTSRKERIKEYIDHVDRAAMDRFYELQDSGLTDSTLKKELIGLVDDYPDYFDPYVTLIGLYYDEDDMESAEDIAAEGFQGALRKITNSKGEWPESLPWGVLGNRHLIRMLYAYAEELWADDRLGYALDLYRKLLKSNPGDNIGARYNILAILMGYESRELEQEFWVGPGMVDAFKMGEWFDKNVRDYPEEFNWWLQGITDN